MGGTGQRVRPIRSDSRGPAPPGVVSANVSLAATNRERHPRPPLIHRAMRTRRRALGFESPNTAHRMLCALNCHCSAGGSQRAAPQKHGRLRCTSTASPACAASIGWRRVHSQQATLRPTLGSAPIYFFLPPCLVPPQRASLRSDLLCCACRVARPWLQEDAQRLAVRVAQLEKEKTKSDKRITETKKRATVILQYRKRNETSKVLKAGQSK